MSDPCGPVASTPIRLQLDEGDPLLYRQATDAIAAELKLSRRWTHLIAFDVRQVEEDGVQAIYEISVGQSAELDWTLEGTTALRPSLWNVRRDDVLAVEAACDALADSQMRHDGGHDEIRDDEDAWIDDSQDLSDWVGDVVAVDPDRGCLFVAMRIDARPPHRGAFWVEPFAFLKALHDAYAGDISLVTSRYLPDRVSATLGSVHPKLPDDWLSEEMRQSPLVDLWRHGWSILWGPPGTGKTHTIGAEVAAVLDDPDSRVLVVSTTNRATDEVAVRIGLEANKSHSTLVRDGSIIRIGKAARLESFEQHGLEDLLGPESIELRRQIAESVRQVELATTAKQRAWARLQLKAAYAELDENAGELFFDPDVRVVVCTTYMAIRLLHDRRFGPMLDEGRSAFGTVVIDEAGLVSRAAAAALSLYAADRVWLVGDSKQLSPISRIERIMAESKARWMASSGLTHLSGESARQPGVYMLKTQYRMHPEIGELVSKFQYDGLLEHASDLLARKWETPSILADVPRAIWYVIDEETDRRRHRIRASRGPGNRSWSRRIAIDVLNKLFRDVRLRTCNGCFITPFRGQVATINEYLRTEKIDAWTASSVHSRQGTEADVVIFDTVNAGSHGWAPHEWKRLVNVGISRGRHWVIVIASRDEMNETYLRPLAKMLWPAVLSTSGSATNWREVKGLSDHASDVFYDSPETIGQQLAVRESLRPVFSQAQQRLCGLKLDGKPRLVRGVAGSGKTVVLAHWVAQTLLEQVTAGDNESPHPSPAKPKEGPAKPKEGPAKPKEAGMIWVIYANLALSGLLTDIAEAAWRQFETKRSFPWDRVRIRHVREVLDDLLISQGVYLSRFGDDINAAAAEYLRIVPSPEPVCQSMFIDESQDFGPATLRLLAALTEQAEPHDSNSKNLNLFYDNAQNIYDRGMPKWSDLGVDLRGRSTVMEESFRSTHPISEYALNVLCRTTDAAKNPEHRELVRRGLIRQERLPSLRPWWRVHYNEIGGPLPQLHLFDSFAEERRFLIERLISLINDAEVRTSQICVLYNGRKAKDSLQMDVAPKLRVRGAELRLTSRESIRPDESTIVATTAHSFKGYDAEIVFLFHVGGFAIDDRILGHPLYVAMTRAKSQLIVSGHHVDLPNSRSLLQTLGLCHDDLCAANRTVCRTDREDLRRSLIARLGQSHADWIDELIGNHTEIDLSPLSDDNGQTFDPLVFHFRIGLFHYVCANSGSLASDEEAKLAEAGYMILYPGDPIPT